MLVPLYGFLRGDTIGLVVLVQDSDRIEDVGKSLMEAASVRVAPKRRASVYRAGVLLAPGSTVADAGLGPLDRIDVVGEDA